MVKFIILAVTLNMLVGQKVQANEKIDAAPLENIEQQAHKKNTELFIIQPSSAAKNLLMNKLAKLEYFSANFNQEVHSEAGELLGQSSGKLSISKPDLVNWHTTEPDELVIVSDGQDVWFYNPWIEQVSVYSLLAAIAQTPILLLTNKDKALWQSYNVAHQNTISAKATADKLEGERFVITSKEANSQIKSLTLRFNNTNGQLKQFSFLDASGQTSHIKLSHYEDTKLPVPSLFKFNVPDGVQIDDQRAD